MDTVYWLFSSPFAPISQKYELRCLPVAYWHPRWVGGGCCLSSASFSWVVPCISLIQPSDLHIFILYGEGDASLRSTRNLNIDICIDMNGSAVPVGVTRLLHSHNPRLVGPLYCCWGFTSLFVSPWLLWFPIRTPSPLIGLPDVRKRFTLVMYWSGPEGSTCVCVSACVCLCTHTCG